MTSPLTYVDLVRGPHNFREPFVVSRAGVGVVGSAAATGRAVPSEEDQGCIDRIRLDRCAQKPMAVFLPSGTTIERLHGGFVGDVLQEILRLLDQRPFISGRQEREVLGVLAHARHHLVVRVDGGDDAHQRRRQDQDGEQQHQPMPQGVEPAPYHAAQVQCEPCCCL
jgi:hypothetical protein